VRLRLPHRRLIAWQPPAHFIVIATGPRGQGKSTLLSHYLENVVRCPAWDPKGEYAKMFGGGRLTPEEWVEEAPYRKSGILRVSVGKPLTDRAPNPDELADDFEKYAAGCWTAGNCMMVVSEISTTGAEAGFCPPTLQVGVNIGRDTRGLSVLLDAQRAEQIPTIVRSQASEWFAFRPTRVQDQKALDEIFRGGDAATLPEHHFIHWTAAQGPVRKVLVLAD
jgi:hypothetical protein